LHTHAPAEHAVVAHTAGSEHVFPSSAVETHTPDTQASSVQAFPSEQEFRLSFACVQCPSEGLHRSSVHGFWSSHAFDGDDWHSPSTQASLVQALPSEQVFVSSLVYTHVPVTGLHVSLVQGLLSLQRTPLHGSEMASAARAGASIAKTAYTKRQKAGKRLLFGLTLRSPVPDAPRRYDKIPAAAVLSARGHGLADAKCREPGKTKGVLAPALNRRRC
jgi:hypothetical protein